MKREKLSRAVCALTFTFFAVGCAAEYREREAALQRQPINCATAEGDIRVLQSEKTNVVQQIALGATGIVPAGMIVGVVTGTEQTKMEVATGEYNKMIDGKIADIKRTCRL